MKCMRSQQITGIVQWTNNEMYDEILEVHNAIINLLEHGN